MNKLRIYHIVNGETTYHFVSDVEHARILIRALAQSDLLDHSIDYNCFGLEEFSEEEKEWQEWYDENGCNIDGNP